MHHDDQPVGRVLSRQDVQSLFGPTGAPPDMPECVVSPALTEGPYFVDEGLNRSDIRTDPSSGVASEGALLQLVLRVWQVSAEDCTPLPDAMVDIWQCDAFGVYSNVRDPGFDTTGQQFLRGYQTTGDTGEVRFTTIYPGWYDGRSVHIHFKVRGQPPAGQAFDFTSQFFFDEDFTDLVYRQAPYSTRGERTYRNEQDSIFQEGGDQLMLDVVGDVDSYQATFDIGVQLG